jgi:hypothetical protein
MAEQPKILHLTLKKKWFDMIASGEKKEEYRDLKVYWANRLASRIMCDAVGGWLHNIDSNISFKHFDLVHFARGGHFHDSIPQITVECLGVAIGKGKPEWGAEGDEYFVIKLGKVLTTGKPINKQ